MADSKPPAVDSTARESSGTDPTSHATAPTTATKDASTTSEPVTTTTDASTATAAPTADGEVITSTADEKRSLDPAPTVPTASDKETGGALPRESGDDDDGVNPPDFQGSVLSNDDLPSPETIRRIGEYAVLDRYGKSHTFKSLYTGRSVARRVLVIFVRHFYCGNCQEYLRALSASIQADSLLHLPVSTFIAVIGCGDPALIDMYAEATGCPFPIYADPTRKLYQELGMIKTLALGQRPAYMSKSLLKSSLDSIVQGVKQIRSGLAIRGGDQRQIGGEFLFEPVDIRSPDASPAQEFDRRLRLDDGRKGKEGVDATKTEDAQASEKDAERVAGGGAASKHSRTTSVTDNDNDEIEQPHLVEEKKVTWCHRMRTTRDHAEIPELMEVLGLTGQGRPIKDQKRWSKALETRKGTGLSMASQMSHKKKDESATAPAAKEA